MAAALLTAAAQLGCSAPDQKPISRLLVVGGWLFDGVDDTRRPNTGILIQDGVLVEIDVAEDLQDGFDGQVITVTGSQTILPGFFDLHAHYNMDLVDQGRVEEVVNNGLVFLANGVISTWSAGEYQPDRVIAHRDQIEAGQAIGPRVFASGPYFGAFRCEYSVKVAADPCVGWPNDITETQIRREVDTWHARGVKSIKIKQATPQEANIIIDQAHRNGMTTAGHLANYNVEYDVSTREAILMGIDRVEHQLTLGLAVDDPRSAEMNEMVDLMLKHQVYYGANLQMYGGINERTKHLDAMVWTDEAKYFTPYARGLLTKRGPPAPESDPPEYAQRVLELMALYDAGGGHLLTVGTDEPVYTTLLPGFAYHRELLAMTYAGLPNAVVLKAATINGARALGVDGTLGSIEEGKRADLVIVEGNPLEDIKAARQIQYVIKNGATYDPQALLKTAEGKIGPIGPDERADWVLTYKQLDTAANQ